MTDNKFNEIDKQKFVDFLNNIAKYAEFKMNTEELIRYFQLLSYMQKTILPKIDKNILEVVRVVESEDKKAKK